MNSQFNDVMIEDVQVFRSGTVYLLIGHGGEKLVVKAEPNNIFKKGRNLQEHQVGHEGGGPARGKGQSVDCRKLAGAEEWGDVLLACASESRVSFCVMEFFLVQRLPPSHGSNTIP